MGWEGSGSVSLSPEPDPSGAVGQTGPRATNARWRDRCTPLCERNKPADDLLPVFPLPQSRTPRPQHPRPPSPRTSDHSHPSPRQWRRQQQAQAPPPRLRTRLHRRSSSTRFERQSPRQITHRPSTPPGAPMTTGTSGDGDRAMMTRRTTKTTMAGATMMTRRSAETRMMSQRRSSVTELGQEEEVSTAAKINFAPSTEASRTSRPRRGSHG